MSKELTEKWKNGELPDDTYYIRCVDVGDNYISCNEEEYEKIDTYSDFDGRFIETDEDEIVEILAPVPSYDEYKKLQEQLKIAKATDESAHIRLYNERGETRKLQEQLKEANELINDYLHDAKDCFTFGRISRYKEKWGVK